MDLARCQGRLFDPDFNPDMSLTLLDIVMCATYVFDGLRRNAVAPGAMQGQTSLTHRPRLGPFTSALT